MKIKFKNGSVVKQSPKAKKVKRSQVIRTLTAMDKEKEQQSQQPSADTTAATASSSPVKPGDDAKDEFYNSGRIGRRNAMPDILGNNSTASSGGDLPLKLSALSTNESTSSQTRNVNETPNQTNNK